MERRYIGELSRLSFLNILLDRVEADFLRDLATSDLAEYDILL